MFFHHNPFMANIFIKSPEKKKKNRKPIFCGVFSGYKMVTLARNSLICSVVDTILIL